MPGTAILSSDESFHSTSRLKAAFEALGSAVTVIDPAREPLLQGIEAGPPPFDLLVPRLGSRFFARSFAFLEALVARGCASMQDPKGVRKCRRKSSVLLGPLPAGVVPVPSALASGGKSTAREAERFGFPVVIKPDVGTQGIGAAVVHDRASAAAYVSALSAFGEDALVQPYLEGGKDVRVFVIGGKSAAAMSRKPAKGDFRANIHRGAGAEALPAGGPWAAPAEAVARMLDLSVAGVDFLEHRGTLYLLEVNASPGLKGIEAATGVRLAEQIAELGLSIFHPQGG